MEENSEIVSDIRYGENETYRIVDAPASQNATSTMQIPRRTFPAAAQIEAPPAPAAKPAPAAAKPAASAAPAQVGKLVGCANGENLGDDGNCHFKADNLAQHLNLAQFDANQEAEKVHTLIPEAYRTLANDGSYDFNLGT
jgi:hypothetical protein